MPGPLRIFLVCSINPIAHALVDVLRDLGHEPVALLGPRRPADAPPPPPHLEPTASSAPRGLDLLFARDKHAVAPLVRAYEPDLLLCWASRGSFRPPRSRRRGSAR